VTICTGPLDTAIAAGSTFTAERDVVYTTGEDQALAALCLVVPTYFLIHELSHATAVMGTSFITNSDGTIRYTDILCT